MVKVLKFFMSLSLLMSLFIIFPSQTSADPLLSALVKKEANNYCNYSASSLPLEESNGIEPELEGNNATSESESINNSEEISSASTKFYSRYRTSKSGSTIYLSSRVGVGFGYCHIFKRHMLNSNGTTGYEYNGIDQFQYATYPASTMDIAMEVINEQNTLVPSGIYHYKQKYSDLAKQTVRVVLAKGNSDFQNWRYSGHDWVIVTMYPQ